MLKSKQFEYGRMDIVCHEMVQSFKNEPENWKMEMHEPILNQGSFSHNHLLVLKHVDHDVEYLISENPLHFHIDMERVFDVLVGDVPKELYLTEVFSKAQKERLYGAFQTYSQYTVTPTQFIENYAKETGTYLRPFKSPQQENIFSFFTKDKHTKYPHLDLD